MILRRLMQHVKDQNWFAVGLDFAIVVSGVVIGIQVANWNDAQADKRRGEAYVDRLAADLRSDLRGRRELAAYFDAVEDSAERAAALLASAEPDSRELVVNAYRATEYTFNPQSRATWDEIVSSGEIGLLPQRALESGLTYYFSYDASEQTFEDLRVTPYRLRVRRTISHPVQRAIREGCSDVRDEFATVIRFQTECVLDVSDAEVSASADALLRDPEVLSDLRLQFSALATARANMRGDIVALERALNILEGGDPVAAGEP